MSSPSGHLAVRWRCRASLARGRAPVQTRLENDRFGLAHMCRAANGLTHRRHFTPACQGRGGSGGRRTSILSGEFHDCRRWACSHRPVTRVGSAELDETPEKGRKMWSVRPFCGCLLRLKKDKAPHPVTRPRKWDLHIRATVESTQHT